MDMETRGGWTCPDCGIRVDVAFGARSTTGVLTVHVSPADLVEVYSHFWSAHPDLLPS